MKDKEFLDKYLWPSTDRLDKTYVFPLPKIDGLKKCGDFIIQCEHEDTFSTNIIYKYESAAAGVMLKEIYKNTQNKVTGAFVRLVGGITVFKNGYPRVSLDAPVLNVNSVTGARVDIATRMYITMPQATPEQRKIFFGHMGEQAKAAVIPYDEVPPSDATPAFWGPRWTAESKGINLDMFRKLRDFSWNSYKRVIDETKEKIPFDYRPLQEYMVFEVSKREHLMFKRMGLSVPVEAQAAFFSAMVPNV